MSRAADSLGFKYGASILNPIISDTSNTLRDQRERKRDLQSCEWRSGMSLTKDIIVDVFGPVDETLATDLVATGATRQQLAAAKHWLDNDEALFDEAGRFPDPKVIELIEIIDAASVLSEDQER